MKKLLAIALTLTILTGSLIPVCAMATGPTQRKLADLEPKAVFEYFEEICSIPHGSGNTKHISDFLAEFAQEQGLRYIQDDRNNIVIFEDGTCGLEGHDPVILQGHMDMVCAEDDDCPLNLEVDALEVDHDDTCVYAHGTTLGADDGIAVSYVMALLADRSIPHPPLEVIITVDEEIGMYGAEAIDLSELKGKTLINLDYEEEGVFMVSCAGGCVSQITLDVGRETVSGPCVVLHVDNLQGGHSGVAIDKNRANAIKVAGEFMRRIRELSPLYAAEFDGGCAENAIPCGCHVTAVIPDIDMEQLRKMADALQEEIRETYDEPGAVIQISEAEIPAIGCLSAEETSEIIDLICKAPNGVQCFSADIPGLVQTSLNLGVVSLDDGFSAGFCLRSSVAEEKEDLKSQVKQLAENFGGAYSESGDYPAWEYKQDSPLRDTMVRIYREVYGEEPVVTAVHGGLECGILADKLPGMDAISIGPQLFDVHTPRERLDFASAERVWNYLLEVLKEL